jgi:hypothetical protein
MKFPKKKAWSYLYHAHVNIKVMHVLDEDDGSVGVAADFE